MKKKNFKKQLDKKKVDRNIYVRHILTTRHKITQDWLTCRLNQIINQAIKFLLFLLEKLSKWNTPITIFNGKLIFFVLLL